MSTMGSARRVRGRSDFGAGRPGIFVLLGVLVLALAAGWSWVNEQLGAIDPGSKAKILIKVPDGATAATLAALLAERGLVRSRYSVLIAARLAGGASHLRAGDYRLSPGDTPENILSQIEGGRTDVIRVTFPEGFTVRQDALRLQSRGLVNAESFLAVAETQGKQFRCDDGFTPPSNDLEGFLYPQTYDFPPDSTVRTIIQAMLDRFDADVVQANPSVRDWKRPVIVASLIEREAVVDKDRPLIAAVIANRLRADMPLQIDASVEYALPEHKARLMFSDLRTPSPYNTYLHRGLPPGAICNPGLPSIDAALHPAEVGYYYYVAGPNGAHLFSRSLAEQDRNIAAVRGVNAPG